MRSARHLVSIAAIVISASLPAAAQAPAPAPHSAPPLEARPVFHLSPAAVDASAAGQPARLPLPWQDAETSERPRLLLPSYIVFAALQGIDAFTTVRAMDSGVAREANPLMRPFAGNAGAMFAIKGAATAATVLAVEKLWTRDRRAAIVTMIALNAAYALVATHNVRIAGQMR
jgi:hypothetical protein